MMRGIPIFDMMRSALIAAGTDRSEMRRAPRCAAVVLLLLCAVSCRARDNADAQRDRAPDGGIVTGAVSPNDAAAGAAALSSIRDGGTAQSARVASSATIDALGTIYPRDVPPHALATRLCDALHAVPARRKAECCGGEPAPFLATECARVLGATLHAGTAVLDESAVERCAAAVSEAVTGCDWVTPGLPPAPDACQQLLRGTLERGAVCRSSLECSGNMHCEGVSPTKTGVCSPPGGEGAGCGSHVDVLATYLSDRRLALSHPLCAEHCSLVLHKCTSPPEEGSACVAAVNCASSQQCVGGRCSAAARRGRGDACGAVSCAEGSRCVDAVCAPLASSGETCRSDVDCEKGACVRGQDGSTRCGKQCSAPLDALRSGDAGIAMRLPVKARADSGPR